MIYVHLMSAAIELFLYMCGLPGLLDLDPERVCSVLYTLMRACFWGVCFMGIYTSQNRPQPRLQRRFTFFVLTAALMIFELGDLTSSNELFSIDQFFSIFSHNVIPLLSSTPLHAIPPF